MKKCLTISLNGGTAEGHFAQICSFPAANPLKQHIAAADAGEMPVDGGQ
jgi:hypothetical protein